MRSILLLLTATIFASCNSSKNNEGVSTLAQKDYEAFALKMDSAISNGSTSFFSENLNVSGLVDNITKMEGMKQLEDKATRADFETGFRQGVSELSQQLGSSKDNGGSYKLLRVYNKDNIYHALFRMNSFDGLNYHDLTLGEVNGKVMINDMYIYLTGENISTTLGKLLGKAADGKSGQLNSSYISEMRQVQEARTLINEGMYEEAYQMINSLEHIGNEKACQVLKLTTAIQLSDETYLRALEEYERLYPNDPSLSLVLIDGFLMKEEYNQALSSINKLDSIVNDPYLDVYRANIYFMMQDIARSESLMLKAISKVKEIDLTAYITLAAIYLEQNKYSETVEVLKKIQKNFSLGKKEVSMLFADNEAFVSSSEYIKWLDEKI